jgi:hypothetical protein
MLSGLSYLQGTCNLLSIIRKIYALVLVSFTCLKGPKQQNFSSEFLISSKPILVVGYIATGKKIIL